MRSGFVWRAGVCGDLKTGRTAGEHLKGGRYYYDAKIVKNYVQGGVIGIRTAIVAHHNGFMEAHVCDVSKCGGDLSEACFRKAGVCKQLLRAGNKVCDSGYSKHCAPIDRKYPGRWYLPCNTRNRGSWMEYMPSYALFRLPAGLTCDKCVLHWYWAGADTCNPPGLREYFEGPDRPRSWGSCVGLGGARGGYARIKTCGARVFPEEYYMCADIRVTSAGGGRSAPPRKEPPVTKAPPSKSKGGKKTYPFVGFRMHVDGRRTGSIFRGRIRRSVGKSSRVAIEAVTKRGVAKVDFFLNGKRVWVDFNRPYFMYGNSGPKPLYGPNLPKRRRFNVMARADGYQIWGNVYLDTR